MEMVAFEVKTKDGVKKYNIAAPTVEQGFQIEADVANMIAGKRMDGATLYNLAKMLLEGGLCNNKQIKVDEMFRGKLVELNKTLIAAIMACFPDFRELVADLLKGNVQAKDAAARFGLEMESL